MSAFKINWSNPEAIVWSPYTPYDGKLENTPLTSAVSVPLPVEVSGPSSMPTAIPLRAAIDIPPPVVGPDVLSAPPSPLPHKPAHQIPLPLRPLIQGPLPDNLQNSHTKQRGDFVAGTSQNFFHPLKY